MTINCQLRPDYAEPTRRLISDTWAAHQAGGGELPIENFLVMLAEISEEDRAKLATRGPIRLTSTGGDGGTFVNQGPTAIEITYMDVKIRMPTVIKGNYVSFAQECEYSYESKFWMRACRSSLCVPIKAVTGTTNRLTIDLLLGPDQCFIFAPEP